MNWQLFDAFGIFLGFTANLIISHTGKSSWRWEVASAVLPTLCLITLIWVIPESPRWFLKKGRYAEAFRAFCAIRATPVQAAAELFYANAQLQAELQLLGRSTPRRSNEQIELEAIGSNNNSGRQYTRPITTSGDIGQEPRGNINNRRNTTAEPVPSDAYGCLSLSARFRYFWKFLHVHDEVSDIDLDDYQLCAKYSYYVDRILQLFRIPRIRRATTAALVMMISQQLCGIVSASIFH